jgi:hypothetical protein
MIPLTEESEVVWQDTFQLHETRPEDMELYQLRTFAMVAEGGTHAADPLFHPFTDMAARLTLTVELNRFVEKTLLMRNGFARPA